MDHPHYRYSALPARASLAWPGGARVAAFAVVYLEHWELAPPADSLRDPRFVGEFGSYFPDYRSWTQREYGNRIGIFRVLDELAAAGIRPAIAANAMAIERLPALTADLAGRGCEFIAHGIAATRMITSRMTEDEERAAIAASIAAIERATGTRPRGWLGQDYGESARTPQLVAESGLDYLLDWPNDDQPYRLTTTPPIVSIPNQAEWDDVQAQWLRHLPPPRYPGVVGEALRTLHGEAGATAQVSGRVFGLHIHPWLSGMSSRIRYLRETLAAVTGETVRDRTWWTTPAAIVDCFNAQRVSMSAPLS
jgi:allantoinase